MISITTKSPYALTALVELFRHGDRGPVPIAELARRRAAWTPPARKDERGYRRLYEDHVLQANEGCDLDFLRGRSPVVSDAVTYL